MKRQLTCEELLYIIYALDRYQCAIHPVNSSKKEVGELFKMFMKIKDDGDVCEIQSYSR